MYSLIVIRHGQSTWNLENRFCGWYDAGLTEKGINEAKEAALLLREKELEFDLAYTSLQQRAIKTLWTVLDGLECSWLPIKKDWRLNERHYGALQGLNKSETTEKFGTEQVNLWRRSYDVPPNPVALDDPTHPKHDRRYAHIPADQLPATESLKEVIARIKPLWNETIWPDVQAGKRILISAHGNSLRALCMFLANMTPEEVQAFNIPTAEPLKLHLNAEGMATEMAFLNSPETIAAKQQAVANQSKAKG